MRILTTFLTLGLLLPISSVDADEDHSRVVVSTTINSTLHVLDAETLVETQPPLFSKGLGPVRLWTEEIDGRPYLFAANHGLVTSSLGVFDATGDLMLELPASPFATGRPGGVGVVAGTVGDGDEALPVAFVTNTWFALGGCGFPNGSVTGFELSLLNTAGVALPLGTVEMDAPIPWAVSLDEGNATAYVSSNCGDTITPVTIADGTLAADTAGQRATGDGADGTIFDADRGLVYTANIDGNSLSVHEVGTDRQTTVQLPGAGPIDINLADTPGGGSYVLTANGDDDSVSLIDRDLIAACIAAETTPCDAEVARFATGVAGGASEGVAYDPAGNTIFVVNKPLLGPSLTAIRLTEDPLVVDETETVPLNVLGQSGPQMVGSIIAFDVAVLPA